MPMAKRSIGKKLSIQTTHPSYDVALELEPAVYTYKTGSIWIDPETPHIMQMGPGISVHIRLSPPKTTNIFDNPDMVSVPIV